MSSGAARFCSTALEVLHASGPSSYLGGCWVECDPIAPEQQFHNAHSVPECQPWSSKFSGVGVVVAAVACGYLAFGDFLAASLRFYTIGETIYIILSKCIDHGHSLWTLCSVLRISEVISDALCMAGMVVGDRRYSSVGFT